MLRSTLLLMGLLSGCSLLGSHEPVNQKYIVEWIGERPLIDRSHLSLTLDKRQQRAHGLAGCNQWFGDFRLDGNNLSIQRCAPSLMEQEQHFLEALPRIERWSFSDTGQLLLSPSTGAPIRLWPTRPL